MKSSHWTIISMFLCVFLQSCAEPKANCPPGYEKMEVVIRNAVRDASFSASKWNGHEVHPYRISWLLGQITGHEATIELGDMVFYASYLDFMHDKEIWLKWLENYPCEFSDEEVERLIKEMNDSTYFIQGEYDPS